MLFTNTISFDAHVLQVWFSAACGVLSERHGAMLRCCLLSCALQIMPTLWAGGALVIAKPQGHLDPGYVAELIVQHQVTSMIFTVPTLASETCRAYRPSACCSHLLSGPPTP